jgi:20S proteasome subunit alpha 4
MDGKPKLYQTEPSGAYNEWKANAIGRNASNLREFLEKKWEPEMGNKEAIKLSIETLLEVVEDAKNIEICVCYDDKKIEMVDDEIIQEVCD